MAPPLQSTSAGGRCWPGRPVRLRAGRGQAGQRPVAALEPEAERALGRLVAEDRSPPGFAPPPGAGRAADTQSSAARRISTVSWSRRRSSREARPAGGRPGAGRRPRTTRRRGRAAAVRRSRSADGEKKKKPARHQQPHRGDLGGGVMAGGFRHRGDGGDSGHPVTAGQAGPGHAEPGADVGPVDGPHQLEVVPGGGQVAGRLGREAERQLRRQLARQLVVDGAERRPRPFRLSRGQLAKPGVPGDPPVDRLRGDSGGGRGARGPTRTRGGRGGARGRQFRQVGTRGVQVADCDQRADWASRVSWDPATAGATPASPVTAPSSAWACWAGSRPPSAAR